MTNLKRIIDKNGVQQRWLAEQVGVTEVSMSRYISGERIPKAPIAIRIADALGVDVKELYGWDDKHVVGEDKDMTTEEAIDILRNTAWLGTKDERERIEEAVEMAANALKAQESCNKLATNLQPCKQDADDTISRAAAQTELMMKCERYTLARESHGMGHVEWSDELIDLSDAMDAIRDLPSAQPEKRTEKRTETHACDCIERQAAIEAMEDVDWYHINKDGQLTHGANSEEDEPLYKAEDVYKVLNDMPSAQQDLFEYSDRLWKAAYERGKAEAQPERKKGKCIWCDSPYRIEYYWIDREGYTASFADEDKHVVATGIAKYCPNCGADMRGEQG